MRNSQDFYNLLGLSRNASASEIKAAYRKMARTFHPDVNPGDPKAEAKFKQINEAYKVLADPKSKSAYDRFGSRWKEALSGVNSDNHTYSQSGFQSGNPFNYASGGDLSDILGSVFGGTRRSRKINLEDSVAPRKIKTEITISLKEAFFGTKRTVQVPANPLTGQPNQPIDFKIPAGVRSGHRVEGISPKSSMVNMTVIVKISADREFGRSGDDLSHITEVSLVDVILGCEVIVPTIDAGSVVLTIPPETQNGRKFRLRGKGMSKLSGGRGDFLVTVKVVLPSKLSQEERGLFLRLQEIQRLKAVEKDDY